MRSSALLRALAGALIGAAAAGSWGCDSGSRAATAPAASAAAASVEAAPASPEAPLAEAPVGEPGARGTPSGLPAGASVFLIQPDGSARDLLALADTVVDVAEVDAAGRYVFEAAPQAGQELLISAEGYALQRAALDAELRLAPEARVEVLVRSEDGAPAELAFALALDEAGLPLALPVEPRVSDAEGALEVTRLPAGRCELLIASPDAQRTARLVLDLASGQTYRAEVTLAPEDALTRRFLTLAGGPEAARLLGGDQ